MLLYGYIFLGHAQEDGLLAMCMYLNTVYFSIITNIIIDIFYIICKCTLVLKNIYFLIAEFI